MRIAIVSDIHGNITGMKNVIAALKSSGGIDKLVVAGDIVTGSSGNSDLINLLLMHNAEIVRGNAEDFISNPVENLKRVTPRFQRYMIAWREWLLERLTIEEQILLTQSPIYRRYKFDNGRTVLVCHSTPQSPWEKVCGQNLSTQLLIDAYGKCEDDIIVYGHNHSNHIIGLGNKILVNVASVGLRSDSMSCYTIIEENFNHLSVKQHAVHYSSEEETELNQKFNIPIFEELVDKL